MTTNFEYYKKEVLEFAKTNRTSALPSLIRGKFVSCGDAQCVMCPFYSTESCGVSKIEWFYAEHVEPIKLTKRERALCEAFEEGWICRDQYGLYYYDSIPVKGSFGWSVALDEDGCRHDFKLSNSLQDQFPFIKWEDERPWKVEDLLKLEVE